MTDTYKIGNGKITITDTGRSVHVALTGDANRVSWKEDDRCDQWRDHAKRIFDYAKACKVKRLSFFGDDGSKVWINNYWPLIVAGYYKPNNGEISMGVWASQIEAVAGYIDRGEKHLGLSFAECAVTPTHRAMPRLRFDSLLEGRNLIGIALTSDRKTTTDIKWAFTKVMLMALRMLSNNTKISIHRDEKDAIDWLRNIADAHNVTVPELEHHGGTLSPIER